MEVSFANNKWEIVNRFSTELPTEKLDMKPLSTAFANILLKASITRRNKRGGQRITLTKTPRAVEEPS
jgi:hypothetical protein